MQTGNPLAFPGRSLWRPCKNTRSGDFNGDGCAGCASWRHRFRFHITPFSDDGIWLISGQVNFLSLNTPAGTMFTASNISVSSLSFDPTQTAQITAEQVARLGNIIRNSASVPRTVDVPDGTDVYLVAGSFNPNPDVTAWGFMTAVKIRNHVD